jgi:hypothetical protein
MKRAAFVQIPVFIVALAGLGLLAGLVPAVQAVVSLSPAVLACLGAVLGLAAGGLRWALLREDASTAPGAEATIEPPTRPAQAPVASAARDTPASRFFDDLVAPAAMPTKEDAAYQPSFHSVLFALGDVEAAGQAQASSSRGVRPSPSPSAPPAEPVAAPASEPVSSRPAPALAAEDRPLQNVAGVSPFGPGTEHMKEAGSLAIEGGLQSASLADLTAAFGDEDEAAPPSRGPDPSRRAAPRAPALPSKPAPVATGAAPKPAPEPQPGVGPVDSVGLFSELFGADPSEAEVPRSAPHTPRPIPVPAAVEEAAGRSGAPFAAPASAPMLQARPASNAAAPSLREQEDALQGLRSNRGPSRPTVPVTARVPASASPAAASPSPAPSTGPFSAAAAGRARPAPALAARAAAIPVAVAPPRPVAAAPVVLQASPEVGDLVPDAAHDVRPERATSEQRIITARLQMGMLRNHADDQRPEFRKGQVPTPRRNAPNNLIMLSRRPEDFQEGTSSEDQIRSLYREFVAALGRCGRSGEVVQYQSFAQRIQSQRAKVREQYDGARIDMSVRVTEGRPRIVMRPAVNG